MTSDSVFDVLDKDKDGTLQQTEFLLGLRRNPDVALWLGLSNKSREGASRDANLAFFKTVADSRDQHIGDSVGDREMSKLTWVTFFVNKEKEAEKEAQERQAKVKDRWAVLRKHKTQLGIARSLSQLGRRASERATLTKEMDEEEKLQHRSGTSLFGAVVGLGVSSVAGLALTFPFHRRVFTIFNAEHRNRGELLRPGEHGSSFSGFSLWATCLSGGLAMSSVTEASYFLDTTRLRSSLFAFAAPFAVISAIGAIPSTIEQISHEMRIEEEVSQCLGGSKLKSAAVAAVSLLWGLAFKPLCTFAVPSICSSEVLPDMDGVPGGVITDVLGPALCAFFALSRATEAELTATQKQTKLMNMVLEMTPSSAFDYLKCQDHEYPYASSVLMQSISAGPFIALTQPFQLLVSRFPGTFATHLLSTCVNPWGHARALLASASAYFPCLALSVGSRLAVDKMRLSVFPPTPRDKWLNNERLVAKQRRRLQLEVERARSAVGHAAVQLVFDAAAFYRVRKQAADLGRVLVVSVCFEEHFEESVWQETLEYAAAQCPNATFAVLLVEVPMRSKADFDNNYAWHLLLGMLSNAVAQKVLSGEDCEAFLRQFVRRCTSGDDLSWHCEFALSKQIVQICQVVSDVFELQELAGQ